MAAFFKSLGWRLFVLTASIVALAVVMAVGISGWIAARAADESVRAALTRASSIQRSFQERRFEQLRLISQLFVADAYLSAYFAEAAVSGDALSILDLLSERQSDLGFDFAIAIDPKGRVLARTDMPGGAGQDLSREPLVRGALEQFGAYGIWSQRDELYHAVAVPIAAGSTLTGFLIAGFSIDDLVALEMQQVGTTEIVFFVGSATEPQVVASTLDDALTDQLVTRLASEGETSAGDQVELSFGGQRWIGVVRDLLGADGGSTARVASLVSLDQQLAPFTRMRWAIAITGVLAVLFAATALLLTTRRALEPVGRLAEAARSAIGGRYDIDVEVEREDEVGELAESFNRLLSDLREKRDMVDYLAKISSTIPSGESLSLDAQPATTVPLDPGGTEDETLLVASGVDPSPRDSTDVSAGDARTFGERFQLLGVLGSGGMGVVYKARDMALDDLVALKTLKREFRSQPEWQRLMEELKLARRITHPNVLRTFDFGNVDGIPFISMEYVRGVSLRYLLSKCGPLPYSAGLHLSRQLCRGLEAVHTEGIIHRDIKPGNLLVEASGNAKLMDFGIARPASDPDRDEAELGMIVGTPDYQAPEQVEGKEPTVRSDLYACGLVCFEIFTGERPFTAENSSRRMLQRLDEEPLSARELRPDIPEELELVIARCLQRRPEDRYPTAAALLADLESLRA